MREDLIMTHTMEMVVKGAIGDIVIDEKPPLPRAAIAHQRDKMPVMDPADDLYFRLELLLSLNDPFFELLHRHELPVGQHPLVYASEPAFAELVGHGESACCNI